MNFENVFENWTYIPEKSNGKYDSRNKIFKAKEYCEMQGSTFVREDFFKYKGGLLLVVEKKDREGISSLLIPGFVREHTIHPLPSDERNVVLRHLNGDNIDGGGKQMDGVFWNAEIGVRKTEPSSGPPMIV